MLLAIDIGNTNSVFAVYDGDALVQTWRRRTEPRATEDEYAVFLEPLLAMEKLSFTDIKAVIISSVVPQTDRPVQRFCAKFIKAQPLLINAGNAGVPVACPDARQVGADRLVNAVAVKAHYQLPAIVIDFGTATTFDVISDSGEYLGGAIAPGVHLSIEALSRATAKLPKVSIKPAARAICQTTEEAIESGMFWGYIGMIEKMVTQMRAELGTQPHVIATGGLATIFEAHLPCIDAIDQDLTLKGLLKIYKEQK